MTSHEPDGRLKFITREEAAGIALAAAKEAVRTSNEQLFGLFGVNIADFDSMQEFRSDLEWARHAREISQRTGARAWTAIVTVAASGLTIALWEYVRVLFGKHP